MERRHFLKLAFGFAAGAAALAAGAHAAPLAPQPLNDGLLPPSNDEARPAVTSEDEANRLQPEQVRHGHGYGHGHGRGHGHHRGWHRGHHWGWRRRHWGWRRRHHGWRRRHWGWHHHRYWRRRYW